MTSTTILSAEARGLTKAAEESGNIDHARVLAMCVSVAPLLAGAAACEVSRDGLIGDLHFDGGAKKIGIIENTQVINIRDSDVQRSKIGKE